jgi:hypothetical protein
MKTSNYRPPLPAGHGTRQPGHVLTVPCGRSITKRGDK